MSVKTVAGDWFGDEGYTEYMLEKINLPTTSRSGSIIFDEATNRSFIHKQLEGMKEKNRLLEQGWKELEKNYEELHGENEKLKIKLATERQKSMKYFNKLKYIQDNHEIFNRLKQAYLSIKYNESMGRPMVEIREKASQTWKVTLCSRCIDLMHMDQINPNLPAIDQTPHNKHGMQQLETISVYKRDVERVADTLNKLKALINQREEKYAGNKEREETYKMDIRNLEYENNLLQNLVSLKMSEIDHLRTSETGKVDIANREVLLLKKIIFKLEHRLRELSKVNKSTKSSPFPLNVKEKELVDVIYNKYLDRIEKKNSSDTPRITRMKSQHAIENKESRFSWKKSRALASHGHGDETLPEKSEFGESETPSLSSQQSFN